MRTRKATFALTAGATALATAFGIGAAHATIVYSADYFPITATLSTENVSVTISNATPGVKDNNISSCEVALYPTSVSTEVTTFVTDWNAGKNPDTSTLGLSVGATNAEVLTGESSTVTITPVKAASGYSVLVTCSGDTGYGAASTQVGSSGGGSGSLDW